MPVIRRIRIDPSNNIGIGTNIPSYLLDVSGNINIRGDILKNGELFSSGGGGSSQWSDGSNMIYYNSGNVGIGSSNPNAKLDVMGNTLISGNVGIGTTLYLTKFNVSGNSYFRGNIGIGNYIPSVPLDVSGNSYFRGNVGIGINYPLQVLDVSGNALIRGNISGANISASGDISASNINFSGNLYQNGVLFTGGSGGGSSQWSDGSNNIIFYNNGNVGLGTSNPLEKLDIIGSIKATSFIGSGASLTNLPPSLESTYQASRIFYVSTPIFNYNIIDITGDNPTIQVTAGHTYAFSLNVSGHPFNIRSIANQSGSNITIGMVHIAQDGTITTGNDANGKTNGTIYWTIPYDIIPIGESSITVFYQCSFHTSMIGNIIIYANNSSQWTTSNNNIYYNGNIGIGTSVSQATLDVSGNINFTGDLYQNNNLYVSSQWSDTSFNIEPYMGIVQGWGFNVNDKLTIPRLLTSIILLNTIAISVAAGESHSLALTSDGTVIGWGSNFAGQSTTPVGLSNVIAISVGGNHNLALKSDGTVVAWGSNSSGQATIPIGLSNVIAIDGGSSHSLALKSDGTVIGWGGNFYGQTTIPVGLSNVISISTGGNHSLALKSDKTVVGWGRNTYGQTTIPAGLSNVIAISAGGNHSLALKADGTVIAWGDSFFGKTTIPAGLSNVTAIAAGEDFSLALKTDKTVVAWGDNNYSQTTIPIGLSNVIAISAGTQHSLVLTIPTIQSIPYSHISNYIGIGTNKPISPLDVSGTSYFRDYVGIGVNNPRTTLDVSGNIYMNDGTAALPIFTFNSDTNTGFYRPGADILGFTTGGIERVRMDASGNMGIGTLIPSSKLHVFGNAFISGTIGIGKTTVGIALDVSGNSSFSGNVSMNANVGIGTTIALAKVHVNDTGAMIIPSGTTAQIPSVAVLGMLRFNIDTGRLEFYNQSGWSSIGSVSATGGNTTIDLNGYRIHTFTSSGNLTVVGGGLVEYLVVAGGGGGGRGEGMPGGDGAGGGGAGGLLQGQTMISAQSYTITVGAGGAGTTTTTQTGANGADTVFANILTIGGGGGGSDGNTGTGATGGSGGGAGAVYQTNTFGGSMTAGQGNVGGNSPSAVNYYRSGGGGGGAGSAGQTVSSFNGGNGGNGITSAISGVSSSYSGGGGGGTSGNQGVAGVGGTGGGGTGGNKNTSVPSAGQTNSGGGGGGGSGYGTSQDANIYSIGANGGSGIVIIRYLL